MIALAAMGTARAEYTETMDPKGLTINLKDCGLLDDGGKSDQSGTIQKAVDDLAAKGGGRLIVPKGTYACTEVALKSNVHLLVAAGTVIKPVRAKNGSGKWAFEIGREAPVENVSIRGLGGRFTISLEDYTATDRVRAISLGDVTNFLISDMDVQDQFTIFSAIILSPPESKKTGFVGPTDGAIQDCSAFHASIGYGLVQAHAAKSVLFKNLYSLGGVAMRLECGVRPKNPEETGGIFDVEGKNIKCQNGYVALLLGPHSTPCGIVKVDGIEAIGCEFAAKFTNGFISKKKSHEGSEPGTFAKGTTVKNVHAFFGMNAQRSPLHLQYTPKALRKYVVQDGPRSLKGSSVTAILDQANYKVDVENLTTEGFKGIKPIITKADAFNDAEIVAMAKKYRNMFKAGRD